MNEKRWMMDTRLEIARNALIDAKDFIAAKVPDSPSTGEFLARLDRAIRNSSKLNTFKKAEDVAEA